jgi:hypothetical protein
MMSPSPLLEKIPSIREGSSDGANARPIKRLQTGALKLRKRNESRDGRYSIQDRQRRGRGRTTLAYSESRVASIRNGRRGGGTSNHADVFTEGLALGIEKNESFSDLQLVFLNLLLGL